MTIVPWFFGFVVLMIGVGMIGSELLSNLMILVQMALYWLFLKWFIANLASNGQPLGLSFSGSVWAYLGWTILAAISVITIIGWAWVYVAWLRWFCRNIQGTRREVLFIGSGLEFLWRAIVAAIASIFIIPIPWVYRWMSQLAGVADRFGRERRATRTPERVHLRWRTEPSCATDATSVPSGLKIRPRVRPRPPCALGESCA